VIGGALYKFIDSASKKRGDSEETRLGVINKGLLFSSGLVAGEALMGIIIAFFVLGGLDMPLLESWSQGGALLDIVSLAGLGFVMWLLVRKALSTKAA
jgi:hypothetical protein